MASLTETAYYTRRTVNWSIFIVIGYVVLRFAWGIFSTAYLAVFPPKPQAANHAFGKLPAIHFPAQVASPSGQLIYQLETIEGSVPRASESANVYFMPKTGSNLLALSTAQNFAKRLGFVTTPIPEPSNKNVYRFDDATAPLRHLWYDIVSTNFILRYSFEQDAGLFLERNVPQAPAAQAEARNLLQTYALFPTDFTGGNVKVGYYNVAEGKLTPVASQSQADAVRIDFFRPKIADTILTSTNATEGPISIILSGSKNTKKRILQFNYTYWPIDYQTNATYPLKSSSLAWQELQSGGGYVLKYPNTQVITVRSVYLAYYDSLEPQTYLQPVFVFEGDDGFQAFVPAVSPDWTE
ncbi:hypothetical protein KBC80_00100 [Candidatus Woesebacteria bacterium]|jgi:hypothetical protein|nr:hypothetical protein [Candidatus Woesebacteria bacterium]